jgi:predicted nucleic acid-binding protein
MIVDASVAFKWLIGEHQSPKASQLLARDDLAAPDFIDLELGQALSRHARQRLITPALAERLWSETTKLPMVREPWRPLAGPALGLSLRLRATFNDCLYLALALSFGDVLVTADERFVRSVRTDRTLHHSIINLAEA